MKSLGTPKTIEEAFENATSGGEGVAAIKDFLRNKLATPFIKHGENPEIMDVLSKLEETMGLKSNLRSIEPDPENVVLYRVRQAK